MRLYLELNEDKAIRFVELAQTGNIVTSTTGKKGTQGLTTTETYEDETQALAAFSKIQEQKVKEGFQVHAFPFPFFGAGYGHYYEWVGVEVRFVTPPTQEQKEKIIKDAPAPIKPDEEDFRGRMLLAGSNQYVNMYIQETYDILTHEDFNEDDTEGFFQASKKASDAFENDIERWLIDIHKFCPIEFVYRREDWEAGGTKLSVWHRVSLESIPQLIQQWQRNPATYTQSEEEKRQFKSCLSGIFNFGEVDYGNVSDTLIDYALPSLKLKRLLGEPDLTEALAYYKQQKNEEYIDYEIKDTLRNFIISNQYAKVNQLTLLVLDSITQDYEFVLPHVGNLVYAALMENNQLLIDHLIQKLSHQQTGLISVSGDCASCDYANNIGVVAYSLHHKDTYIQAQRMYEIALDIQTPEPCKTRLEMYNNALWVLQYDNTGLPVNATLNEKFLDKCLPYGPQNPAIFFNAACLYVEMNEFDKATECAKQAITYNYNGIEMMKTQIKTEKMFAGFRNYPPLIELFGW